MGLPSLCTVNSPLWQRVVDDLCQTRAATQWIPPPLPLAPAAHQVARQSHQHQGPGACWLTEHAITAHSVMPLMARPCTSHGVTACQEKSFTENCGRASVAWADRCCATRTSSSETCFHKALLRHLQQRLPLQDRATQSYKILPKSLALTIASLRPGCHYYYSLR